MSQSNGRLIRRCKERFAGPRNQIAARLRISPRDLCSRTSFVLGIVNWSHAWGEAAARQSLFRLEFQNVLAALIDVAPYCMASIDVQKALYAPEHAMLLYQRNAFRKAGASAESRLDHHAPACVLVTTRFVPLFVKRLQSHCRNTGLTTLKDGKNQSKSVSWVNISDDSLSTKLEFFGNPLRCFFCAQVATNICRSLLLLHGGEHGPVDPV